MAKGLAWLVRNRACQRGADPDKVADTITGRFARMRKAAAVERAERFDRVAAEVERQKSTELSGPLSKADIRHRSCGRVHRRGLMLAEEQRPKQGPRQRSACLSHCRSVRYYFIGERRTARPIGAVR